jgi:predicted secreted protein
MASSLNKYPGSQFLLQVELASAPGTFQTVGGCDSNALSIGQESVDITDKQAMPWRTLLPAAGMTTVSLKAAGFITGDAAFKQLLAQVINLNPQPFYQFKMISAAGDVFKGLFEVTALERTGDKNTAEKFSISLESSGPIAYTPAP